MVKCRRIFVYYHPIYIYIVIQLKICEMLFFVMMTLLCKTEKTLEKKIHKEI